MVLGILAACTGGAPPTPSRSAGVTVFPSPDALNATTAPLLPTDRFELPEVSPATFQDLLSQLRGTPVVVNFWASWCQPCREEGPHLAEAAREFGDRVQFLGVDIQDERTLARLFIREFGWPYPSVFDPAEAVKNSFGFVGQPVTVFFDREGERVTLRHAGFEVDHWGGAIPRETLLRVVERLAGS
jgi:thiol-disulfide isomerase/thioredoxin